MNRLEEQLSEIYNLSVILKEFCSHHSEIEEIMHVKVLAKYISKNADLAYSKLINEE